MPSESLPAKLRELADRHEVTCVEVEPALRAAAEQIEHLEGTLPAMKWMRQAEAAEAELDRARAALRAHVIQESGEVRACLLCPLPRRSPSWWIVGQPESHNPVTLKGVEGPCPARPKEGV